MPDLKAKAYQHVRSARQWLVRAEENFSKNQDIRAELNLFLAKAELQHLQEKKRAKSLFGKYRVFRHILAATVAVSVVGVSFGTAYWYLYQHKEVIPIPLVTQYHSEPVKNVKAELVDNTTLVQQLAHSNNSSSPAKPVAIIDTVKALSGHQEGINNSNQIDKDISLPPNEMQKLLRAAGRSLRGE